MAAYWLLEIRSSESEVLRRLLVEQPVSNETAALPAPVKKRRLDSCMDIFFYDVSSRTGYRNSALACCAGFLPKWRLSQTA